MGYNALPQRLANSESAWVPLSKMTEYLLNPLNPQAGNKPADFAKMGYDLQNINILERDLISVAQNYPPIEERIFPDYATYRVEGHIATPEGGNRHMRTVWEIRPEDPRPRPVTAYPVRPPAGG